MTLKILGLLVLPLMLVACGTTSRTVVVTPQAGQTVVVTPPSN